MYSDIIPPKKKYVQPRTQEYNSVRFSAPHQQPYTSYAKPTRKIPIVLFFAACVVIGLGLYHIIAHRTAIDVTPKTTRFDIQQNIPLILQGREDKSLTYGLVYIPTATGQGVIRNPFATQATSSNSMPDSSQDATQSSDSTLSTVYLYASTTGKKIPITLINTTNTPVSLKKDTRFDVGGDIYMLDSASQIATTEASVRTSISSTTPTYRILGFKGYDTYDTVYAVPYIQPKKTVASTNTNTSLSTSTSSTTPSSITTTPTQEILSLLPAETLALQKNTIYDKMIDQTALVVFDERVLEEYLKTHIKQTKEYYETLKPFGESISYEISILDYKLQVSEETGKPTGLSSISLEITPRIDKVSAPLQFAGFSRDAMDILEKNMSLYINMQTSYTPFWSKQVSAVEKIQFNIFSQNQ